MEPASQAIWAPLIAAALLYPALGHRVSACGMFNDFNVLPCYTGAFTATAWLRVRLLGGDIGSWFAPWGGGKQVAWYGSSQGMRAICMFISSIDCFAFGSSETVTFLQCLVPWA